MTVDAYLARQREADFQAAVITFATLSGWRHFHVHNMRRSDVGWPDLFLVRPAANGGRAIAAELKRVGQTPTQAQRVWLEELAACGIETYAWTPASWPEIEEVLR